MPHAHKHTAGDDINEGGSPSLSARLREVSDNLKALCSSSHRPQQDVHTPKSTVVAMDVSANDERDNGKHSPEMKQSLVQEYLQFLNTASKEDLKRLKGIGEKRATYILELREESPEPFKSFFLIQVVAC